MPLGCPEVKYTALFSRESQPWINVLGYCAFQIRAGTALSKILRDAFNATGKRSVNIFPVTLPFSPCSGHSKVAAATWFAPQWVGLHPWTSLRATVLLTPANTGMWPKKVGGTIFLCKFSIKRRRIIQFLGGPQPRNSRLQGQIFLISNGLKNDGSCRNSHAGRSQEILGLSHFYMSYFSVVPEISSLLIHM